MLRPMDQATPETICREFRLLIALTGLVLIWQTWPLWLGTVGFPQVPLVDWFLGAPAWWDRLGAGIIVLSLLVVLIFYKKENVARPASFLFFAGLWLAVLLNQHRLQPWAYEFCILLLIMATLPSAKAVPCLRLIVASIYLHSGLSKLDVTFLTTHGEALLSVLTDALGYDLASAPVGVRRGIVAMLPLGEILVAGGLLLPKTRRVAKWISVVMHLVLLWILGPWGLGHKPGVLIWNVYFIVQNLLLFRSDANGSSGEFESGRWWQRVAAYGIALGVVFLPFLEPLGWFDHWPAWAVYASRPERIRVYVAENRVADLPAEVQKFVTPHDPPADAAARFLAGKLPLKRLLIDRWSLEALKAPIYPEDRFQIGVALALAKKHNLQEDIRIEIESPADRWTGKRTMNVLEGTEEIEKAAGEFLLNAEPR